MNQRTGKLLRKYASHTGKNRKEIRKLWEAMNWKERTKMRRKIKSEIGE